MTPVAVLKLRPVGRAGLMLQVVAEVVPGVIAEIAVPAWKDSTAGLKMTQGKPGAGS